MLLPCYHEADWAVVDELDNGGNVIGFLLWHCRTFAADRESFVCGLQLWCQSLEFPEVEHSPSRPELFDTQTPLELSHTLCSANVPTFPWDSYGVLYSEGQGYAEMSLPGLTFLTLLLWSNEYILQ